MSKETRIKVSPEVDLSHLEELSSLLTEVKTKGESVGDSLTSSMSKVTDEVSSLALEYGSLIDVLDETSSSTEELKSSMDNAESSSENVNQTVSNMDSSSIKNTDEDYKMLKQDMDDTNESAEQTNETVQNMGAAVSWGAAASQISQYGQSMENFAQNANTTSITLGQLAIQTGISEDRLRNMITSMSNATFPKEDAMMYVKSLDQIGVSSENLAKSATDLDSINDAFQLNANMTNSLGQELSVLGVDMNNVSSSFNALAYANANTVGGMDNYYSFLKKYDAQFHELGFNVDQASVIIAGATQKFGGGKAALSGLNDALKESNGDTRALEEALGLQAGSIDNATQLTGEYEGQLQNMADEESEHTTIIENLSAAFDDLVVKAGPVPGIVGSIAGAIGQVGSFGMQVKGLYDMIGVLRTLKKTANFSNMIDSIKNFKLVAKFSDVIGHIKDLKNVFKFSEVISSLGGFKTKLLQTFSLSKVMESIKGLKTTLIGLREAETLTSITNYELAASELAALWPWLLLAAAVGAFIAVLAFYLTDESFKNWVDNTVLPALWNLLNFLATLPMMIPVYLATIIANLLGFGDTFTTGLQEAASNGIGGFLEYLGQLPQKAWEEFNEILNRAGEFASQLPQIILTAGINLVTGWITGTGEHSPGFMYDMFLGELTEMANIIPTIGQQIISNIMNLGVTIVTTMVNALTQLYSYLSSMARSIFNLVSNTAINVISGIVSFLVWWYTLPAKIAITFTNIVARALGFGNNFVQRIVSSATNAVSGFMNNISSLPGRFNGELQKMLGYAKDFLVNLPATLKNAAINVVKSWIFGTGEHSPGFMYDAFEGEIKEMVDVPVNYSPQLNRNINKLGSSMVDTFGNPTLSFDMDVTGFANSKLTSDSNNVPGDIINLNIEVGTVDNEKRVQEIVDVVRRELAWNNRTAGRTV